MPHPSAETAQGRDQTDTRYEALIAVSPISTVKELITNGVLFFRVPLDYGDFCRSLVPHVQFTGKRLPRRADIRKVCEAALLGNEIVQGMPRAKTDFFWASAFTETAEKGHVRPTAGNSKNGMERRLRRTADPLKEQRQSDHCNLHKDYGIIKIIKGRQKG